ncbi:hypothetical protein TARUN_5010 [Trichoderma arundinaceum]|uniref:BZIP domain-containing protein n=1 Tax=Trichoderma arundinaceum TaxID=490622 RepID=A0A395NMM0_TRIAR|nr:hypothetical protein TARUN_5010 [Trichoderma arundinaceum]
MTIVISQQKPLFTVIRKQPSGPLTSSSVSTPTAIFTPANLIAAMPSAESAQKARRVARRSGPGPQVKPTENDESLEKRRQRNRKAQRLFRLRRQAAHANYEKSLVHMEGALEQMAATFLDFTNGILQSPLISRDPALISKLRSATDSILLLCQGSSELEGSSEGHQKINTEGLALGSSTSDDAEFQQNDDTNGELPQATTQDNIFVDFNAFNQPTPAPQSTNNSSPLRFNASANVHTPPIKNIFGNGFISLPPIDFTDCAHPETMLQTYPSEDSLSIIFTRASLQHAYDAILSDTLATSPLVDRIFGFPLKFRSRDEILMILRWYLRPQTAEIVRLATAEFDEYLVAQYYHGIITSQYSAIDGVFRGGLVNQIYKSSPPPPQSRILNAYQIEQWLLACGMKYLDVDTIELTDIKPTGLLLNRRPPSSPDALLASFASQQQQQQQQQQQRIPLQTDYMLDGQVVTGYNTSSETAKNIRLSRSRLIHVLTGISFCIDKGPGYCERALLEAIISAMIAGS